MKRLAIALLAGWIWWLPAGQAYAQPTRPLTATATGLDGDTVASSAAITDTIAMRGPSQHGGAHGWELALHGVVTVGTTTQVDVQCEESHDNSTWAFVHYCTDQATSVCTIQTLQFDVSTTATVSLVLKTRAPYVRCTFDDTSDGSGTIVVTGTVSAL